MLKSEPGAERRAGPAAAGEEKALGVSVDLKCSAV